MSILAAALLPLLCTAAAHADEPAPTPATTARVVYEDIDLTGTIPKPELQIFVERQPLPDLSTEALLEQIDDRLEALEAERD